MLIRKPFCYSPDSGNSGGGDGQGATGDGNSDDGKKADPSGEPKDKGESILDELPDDLKQTESLKKFKSKDDVVRSYVALEKKLGRSVELPQENASDEDYNKLFDKLGRPKDPDGYKLGEVLSNEALAKRIAAKAHAVGVIPKQAKALAAELAQYEADIKAAAIAETAKAEEARVAARTEAQKKLEAKYGDQYGRAVGVANAAFSRLFSDELQKEIADKGLASHPEFVEALIRVGKNMGGDSILRGDKAGPDTNDPKTKYAYMRERYKKD